MTQSRVGRIRSRIAARWSGLQDRHAWLRHVVGAWQLLSRNNGNQYAAAITYFSFLALFPLLLLAVSITGFVLKSDPSTEQAFFNHLTDNIPGSLGQTFKSSIKSAIASRTGLGIVGLAGVLLTGLGWIGNLRTAIDAVWARTPPAKVNFFKVKVANLFVLAGLGIGTVLSLGLTVIGTSLTNQILRALSLDDLPGATALLKLLGIAIAVVGDMIIFWWLLIRMPQMEVPGRIAFRGALLAAVGFEVLKIVGTYTVAHTANSPTAGPFAGLLAVLIWIQLVARWMLFACAWTATVTAEHLVPPANQLPIDEPPAVAEDDVETAELSPAAVGMTLIGAGMVAGAAATWALTRPRPARRL
jgi:membrane protein